mgnify:CR=1 FL=1
MSYKLSTGKRTYTVKDSFYTVEVKDSLNNVVFSEVASPRVPKAGKDTSAGFSANGKFTQDAQKKHRFQVGVNISLINSSDKAQTEKEASDLPVADSAK